MQVILLEKVKNLGDLGQTVNVKSGYGRNYLIPGGKAVPATANNIAEFEARRAELEKIEAEAREAAEKRRDQLAEAAVTIAVKAGAEGKLFGSVGTADIAAAVTATGTEVSRNEVRLPDGAIRETGEYQIEIQLHADVSFPLSLSIVAEV